LTSYGGQNNTFAWPFVVNNGENIIAVANPPGSWFDEAFDNIEGSVEFQPSLFAVAADLTTKTLTITPSSDLEALHIKDIEPTGNLIADVMLSRDRHSHISNNFFVSTLSAIPSTGTC
jgi:hypothetical protein